MRHDAGAAGTATEAAAAAAAIVSTVESSNLNDYDAADVDGGHNGNADAYASSTDEHFFSIRTRINHTITTKKRNIWVLRPAPPSKQQYEAMCAYVWVRIWSITYRKD